MRERERERVQRTGEPVGLIVEGTVTRLRVMGGPSISGAVWLGPTKRLASQLLVMDEASCEGVPHD